MKMRNGHNMTLIMLLSIGLMVGVFYLAPNSEAAIGDGKIVYGTGTTAATPKYRDYTVSSGNWSSESTLPAADTTILTVVVEANSQVDEYVAAVLVNAGGSNRDYLYVYTYSGGSWSSSWNVQQGWTNSKFECFDIAFEQNSGDCMVVYSNAGTSNPLSYRKRVDGTWDSSSTTIAPANISTAVDYVEMESQPNSDKIALVFSTSNGNLDALIWDGSSSWGTEPSAVLSSTLGSTSLIVRPFDLAYEQSSGDLLVAYAIGTTAGVGLARLAAGSSTWQDTDNEGVLSDPSTGISLGAEPGTDYIAFSSIDYTNNDLQLAIWDGTQTSTPFSFAYTYNDADISCSLHAETQVVASGWAGSGLNRRALFCYRDEAGALAVNYFTWKKDTATWEGPNSFTGGMSGSVSQRGNWIRQDPNFSSTYKAWYIDERSSGALWTFTYDGSSATGTWTTVDDGSAGDNAVSTDIAEWTYLPNRADFTDFDPTLVELTDLQVETQGNKSVITWRTASELRTRGFRLYRTLMPGDSGSYEEITHNIIPAWGNPFSGRQYQYTDKNPLVGTYYILEEVLKDGNTKRFRPVQLDNKASFIGGDAQEQASKPLLRRDGRFEVEGNVLSRRVKEIPHSKIKRNFQRNFNPLKIEIDKEGIYRISAQDMIKAGWDISNVVPRMLAVYNQGEQIPIYVSGQKDERFSPSGYIEFYGKPVTTRYTKTNIYWLESLNQPGLRMQDINSNYGKVVTTIYNEIAHLEDKVSYYPEFKGSEHWFFPDEFISPYSADYSLGLDHIVRSADKAVVRAAFQGGSKWGFGPDYTRQRALVSLNGTLIGEANWSGDEECIFNQDVPISLLLEGDNKVTIEAPDEGGGLSQFFTLKWIDITYPRELLATKNRIIFNAGANQGVTSFRINGFTSSNIVGFTVSGDSVSRLDNLKVEVSPAGGCSVTFSDPQPANKRYILVGGTRDVPSDIYPDLPSSLKGKDNQADYIVITHASLSNGLEPLVNLRRSQGLTVKVVDVQDIYDEFNYGIFSPEAIRDFLKYAYENWQRPRPTFVLLVGDGTFDYQDYWQLGQENLVPVYLVYSPDFGETVSDNWFVDFNDDRMPEMFIGRFPVRTEAQLGSVINKILAYERTSPNAEWTKKLLFVADSEKGFEDGSDSLIGVGPSDYTANKLYLSLSTPQETRQGIIDNLNQGALIFNYTGHGGIRMFSSGLIFQNSDVASLNNDLKPTMLLALDCTAGYFIYPEGLDSVSEVLLNADKKGAIACIASSGTSSLPEQKVFGEGFYKAFFEADGAPVLGALHFKAKGYLYENRSLVGSNTKVYNVIQTFNLLGDPAMILRRDGAPSGYSLSQITQLQDTIAPQTQAVPAPAVFNLDEGKVNTISSMVEEPQTTSASTALADVTVSAKEKDLSLQKGKKGLTKIIQAEEEKVASPSRAESSSDDKVVKNRELGIEDIQLEDKTVALAPPKWRVLSKSSPESLQVVKPSVKIDYGAVEENVTAINKDAQQLAELRTKFDEAVQAADLQKAKSILRLITKLARKIYWRTF